MPKGAKPAINGHAENIIRGPPSIPNRSVYQVERFAIMKLSTSIKK